MRWLFAVALVGCGSAGASAMEEDGASPPSDSGTDVSSPEPDADANVSMKDAASDALDEAPVDAGPALGQTCTSSQTTCPPATDSSGQSENQVCWDQPGPMNGRCTFYCFRLKDNQAEPDPKKAQLCEALGGECLRWKPDGLHICQVD
jgi:hypothetical protein